MPYNPIPINDLRPGADAANWDYPAQNHNELYEDTVCHIAGTGNVNGATSSSTSYGYPVLGFRLARNTDNNRLRVKIRAKTDDSYGVAACVVKVLVDSTDAAEGSTTSNTGAWITIDVTLTTSSTNRDVYVYLKTSDATVEVQLLAANAYVVGSAPAAGVLTSDFIPFSLSASAPAGAPIATEYVQRIGDGPIRIAKDRLLTLASFMDNAASPLAKHVTTSTTWILVYIGRVFLPDTQERDYLVSVFQGPSGSAPESLVSIAGQTATFTGVGFFENTFKLSGSSNHNQSVDFRVLLRSTTGANPVGLGTVQIRRA